MMNLTVDQITASISAYLSHKGLQPDGTQRRRVHYRSEQHIVTFVVIATRVTLRSVNQALQMLVAPGDSKYRYVAVEAGNLRSNLKEYVRERGFGFIEVSRTAVRMSPHLPTNGVRPVAPPEPKIRRNSARVGIEICRRLGNDWETVADYFEISASHRRQFQRGRECQAILQWLDERKRSDELAEALRQADREDLALLLTP